MNHINLSASLGPVTIDFTPQTEIAVRPNEFLVGYTFSPKYRIVDSADVIADRVVRNVYVPPQWQQGNVDLADSLRKAIAAAIRADREAHQ